MTSELICDFCGKEILPSMKYIKICEHIFCNKKCETSHAEWNELMREIQPKGL